ncbi:MAG: protein kinase [Planctomycetota bacterium]|nr:protein kinase [Planctomycetota bacterium]
MVRLSFERGEDGEIITGNPSQSPLPDSSKNPDSTLPSPDQAKTELKSDLTHSMVDPSTPVLPSTPESIGPFRVIRHLGSGASGHVFLGHDEELDRSVALKWLTKNVESLQSHERFSREAKAMAAIEHPAVVDIYSTGEHENRPYMAMQYVSGGDLKEELEKNGPRPITPALEDMRRAAEGLRAAHQLGLIHRDIKPANLLREELSGQVKVADFGLAREQSVDSSLTASGVILGTPYYLAPELIEEGKGDHRSDIYSLGATFHHLLTGSPPYEGKTAAKTLFCHVSEPIPDAHEIRPIVSKSIAQMLARCLAKDPSDRYQDYGELIEDLDLLIEGKDPNPQARSEAIPVAKKARISVKLESASDQISVTPRSSDRIRIAPEQRVTAKISNDRRPASATRRFFAFLVDFLLVTVLPFLVGAIASGRMNQSDSAVGMILGAYGSFALLSVLIELAGNSPGKELLGLRIQGRDHKSPGVSRRFLRFCLTRHIFFVPLTWAALPVIKATMPLNPSFLLGLAILTGALFFDLISGLYSEGGIHDSLSGTRVVKERGEAANNREPSLLIAALLWLPPLGLLGLHRIYLQHTLTGTLWMFTGSLFGLGWLFDAFALPFMVLGRKQKILDRRSR